MGKYTIWGYTGKNAVPTALLQGFVARSASGVGNITLPALVNQIALIVLPDGVNPSDIHCKNKGRVYHADGRPLLEKLDYDAIAWLHTVNGWNWISVSYMSLVQIINSED